MVANLVKIGIFLFGQKTIGYTDTICCRLIFQRDATTVNQLPCVSYQQYAMLKEQALLGFHSVEIQEIFYHRFFVKLITVNRNYNCSKPQKSKWKAYKNSQDSKTNSS